MSHSLMWMSTTDSEIGVAWAATIVSAPLAPLLAPLITACFRQGPIFLLVTAATALFARAARRKNDAPDAVSAYAPRCLRTKLWLLTSAVMTRACKFGCGHGRSGVGPE